jgi:hypothetical protein
MAARDEPLVAHADPGLGLPAGRVWRAHGHHEAVPRHRDAAFDRVAWCCWRCCACRRCATPGRPGRCRLPLAAKLARRAVGHDGLAGCCRCCWAAGSAPTTRCWPAPPSPPARAAGGPPWTLPRAFRLWRPLGMLQDGSPHQLCGADGHSLRSPLDGLCRVAPWHVAGACNAPYLRAAQARLAGGWLRCSWPRAVNVVLDWPLLAAVLHTGGAAALVVVLTWALGSSRASAAPRTRSSRAIARTESVA